MTTASISHLHQFFEAYADCLGRGDARGIAQLFTAPCLMISDDKTSAFTDLAAVEVLFLQGFGFLKKHGIATAVPDVRSRREVTSKIVQVAVQWSYYNSDRALLYTCDYLYTLHHKEGTGWKIETAISVNEKERMQEMMAKSS